MEFQDVQHGGFFMLYLGSCSLIPVLTLASLAELILINSFHRNLFEVIYVVILVSFVSLTTLVSITVINLFKSEKRNRRLEKDISNNTGL